jgi:hypothetical protein
MKALIQYVCDEMDDLEKKAEKGKLSMSEIEYADKLAHLKKNILRSDELMDEGYSGDSHMDGYRMYPYSMNDGMSYARGRGSNARRDSMGRYSSDDGRYSDYSRDDYSERRR